MGDGQVACGPVAQVLNVEAISQIYKYPIDLLQTSHGRLFMPQRGVHGNSVV
jgi:hypothetical protein